MERVQFQQEQMLAELKDLQEKGLFTQKEVKQIMVKRTAFETALVRRIPKKSDFLRYATYEMGLEALRRKRAKRLKLNQGPRPRSVSDYALVRRQFHIFERALKKFKSDVGLWIQYIQVAKKEGARTLVGRITARAMQLHPNVPALYILAASHELEHLSPSAARALLQRGIRLNAESIEMWREYVKMELGFVESLRRRWDVLGIEVKDAKGKGKQREEVDIDLEGEEGQEQVGKMQVDAENEGDEGEAARKEIMEGAIVKSVITSAVKALPKFELFRSLHELLSTYPCPASLRIGLLDHLITLLESTLPSDPAAIKLAATRSLASDLAGEDLVDALKGANERLTNAVKDSEGNEGLATAYAEFVEEWCRREIDDSLKGYLITSLQLLAQRKSPHPSPSLRAATITLLAAHQSSLHAYLPPSSRTPEKVLQLARKFSGQAKDKGKGPATTCTSARVWLARLGVEEQFADDADVERTWEEARGAVEGEGTERVWAWGLDWAGRARGGTVTAQSSSSAVERARRLEGLLAESKRIGDAAVWTAVHELLLLKYAESTHAGFSVRPNLELDADSENALSNAQTSSEASRNRQRASTIKSGGIRDLDVAGVNALVEARIGRVRHIATAYFASESVWKAIFTQEAAFADDVSTCLDAAHGHRAGGRILEMVYEYWRKKDLVSATVEFAQWLLGHGKAREAKGLVMNTVHSVKEEEAREVERRWQKVVGETDAAAESSHSDA